MVTTNIKLSGVTCAACQKIITKRISTIVGVKEVKAELTGKTFITSEKEISVSEINTALVGTPYKVVQNH